MKSFEKKTKSCPTALLRFFLYAFFGALTALPMAIPSLWFIGWAAPAPVLFLEFFKGPKKDSYLRAYGRGMSFFWFFGAVLFYWFWELYPLDFLGFEKWSALITVLLATLGIPLLQASVSSFVFVGLAFIRKKGLCSRRPLISALFTASLFTLSEYCHTLTWLGVPWGRFAIGQTECLANVQSASLFGSYFITFLMIFTASLLAFAFKYFLEKQNKRAIMSALLALTVFFANFIYGSIKMSLPIDNSRQITVGAVQGNIRFEDKWADKKFYTFDVYASLTKEAADHGAELIIWPETALPYDITENEDIPEFFSNTAKVCTTDILATAFETEGNDLYNTARLAYKDGTFSDNVYKKRHLVPFGEYIPMESLVQAVFPPLADLSSMMDQVSPGADSALLDTENGKLGVLICFDSIYENLCMDSVRDGAALIAISTNDSWFSGSTALSQHNAQAQLRAIENGRYIVRSANTGISSVIDPKGRVISSIGDGEEGYICEKVSFIEEKTLYTATGNLFVAISAIFVIISAATVAVRSKKREKIK